MLNHHRGLWGYSGPAADGAPLTIQSTGLGGPSAAAVVAELIALGARRLVRVGTAAGLGATPLGALVVADAALAADGASRALGAGDRGRGGPGARRRARRGGDARRGLVASRRHPRPGARGRVGRRPARSPSTSPPRRCSRPPRATARRRARCSRSRGRAASGSATTSSTPRRRRSGRRASGRARRGRPGDRRGGRRRRALGLLRRARACARAAFGAGLSTSSRSCSRGTGAGAVSSARARCATSAASFASCASIAASRSSGGWAVRATSSKRRSSRSTPSSIPSSRCETDRSRRVSRSRSAADGQVERAHRRLLRGHGALARLERAADRAGHERVLQEVLRELAERVLALAGDPVAQLLAARVVVCHRCLLCHAGSRAAARGNVAQTAVSAACLSLEVEGEMRRRSIDIRKGARRARV